MNLNNVAVLGLQWGDEGKGKIVDLITSNRDAVVRFQGGHNAGHTLVVQGKKRILRLIPSGIFHPNVICYLGNGVVLSPVDFIEEVEALRLEFSDVKQRLKVSSACCLVLPQHIALDQAREKAKGSSAIGTTGRGIGPAYEDKIARRAIRVSDLFDKENLKRKLEKNLAEDNFILTNVFKTPDIEVASIYDACLTYADYLESMVEDVAATLSQKRKAGQRLLFEGAQGFFLDIDHGTYPFVTSSNTSIGAVTTGSGFPVQYMDYTLGICKAYTTRVGGGPFPTELFEELGTYLAQKGNEFGSVTGRLRRCGWFDAPIVRRAIQINGISGVCLTKLDILDELSEIKLCTHYELNDQKIDVLPIDPENCAKVIPIFETLPGWQQSTYGITSFEDLPQRAKAYVERIQTLIETRIDLVSTGPARNQMIQMNQALFGELLGAC